MSDVPATSRRAWHACPPEQVVGELETSLEQGLTPVLVRTRLERDGPNEIEAARERSVLQVVGTQFRDVMTLVLVAAAVVSGVVGDLQDAVAILVIVVLNAGIGAAQELRAARAIAALKRMSEPESSVLRDGAWTRSPARGLVLGDVVRLEAGDVAPADLRLVESVDLDVDEAPLTGESVPIHKDAQSALEEDAPVADRVTLAHCGTAVTRGRGTGVVVATGQRTELGRIAQLLEGAGTPRTPLQVRLARFGLHLSIASLAICALVFAAGIARGESAALMFLTAVSLAVAAIPEALPAVVTVALALGARKMAGRNALVRRLPAVETLGSVTVICSDKTGTLTQNRMHVDALWAAGERLDRLPATPAPDTRWDLVTRALALNNDATFDASTKRASGEPTEAALLEAAAATGRDLSALASAAPRIGEVAFEGGRRRMTTLHPDGSGALAFVKGAPETVLERCTGSLDKASWGGRERETVLSQAEELAAEGYRVLAVAAKRFETRPSRWTADELESELSFLALVALIDPPRPEAAQSIRVCQEAGIRPVMITGDHPGTARAIAHRLGIAGEDATVLTGDDLQALAPGQLEQEVDNASVFARVSPEQKIDIVRALQRRGEFVAMTGDGVNDAPALQRAEIGVAMGVTGTEVAREAADMTLLDDNFATIVSAVREGRRVFDNIRKFVRYTMTSNSGEVWTLFLAPLLGLPVPLLPIQILWINLVTDGLPGLALSVESEEEGLMRRPPRPPRESLFARGLWQHVLLIGLLIAGLSIGAQAWAYGRGSESWQSMVFTVLTLSQLVHALAIRSESQSLFRRGLASNPWLAGAVLITVGLQLAVVYVPFLQPVFHTTALSSLELGVCFGLALVVLVAVEIEKLLVRRVALYGTAG